MDEKKEYLVGEIFRQNDCTYICKSYDDGKSRGYERVYAPVSGMLFRASNGVLYELVYEYDMEDKGQDEMCACLLSNDALNCLDIDSEAFGDALTDAYHWYPIAHKKQEEEKMDYSKINIKNIYIKRHIELAVVKVDGDLVTFRIAEQTHRREDFTQNGEEFVSSSGYRLVAGSHPQVEEEYDRLFVRGWSHDGDERCLVVSLEAFAKIMEAITEYNETNGAGYEKPWPQNGDKYLCIDSAGCINEYDYYNDYMDEVRRKFGNFFRTLEEAEAARERARKALKGVDENKLLREALEEAVSMYGKPGGPWNVPGDAGGWLDRARKALETGNE